MDIDFTQIFGQVFSEYGLLVTGMGSMVVYLLRDKSKMQDKYEALLKSTIEALNNTSNSLDNLTDRFNRNG